MYSVEESLFLSANNKVSSAKTLINECKNLIDNYVVDGDASYTSAKSSIDACDIETLVSMIDTEKDWLMEYDQDFAKNYMSLLIEESLEFNNVDFENMSDEEKAQYFLEYDSFNREINDACLFMLEKKEENGMLTDEMKSELDMRKKIAERYDLTDQMSLLDPTSDEYIKLLKESGEIDVSLIEMDPTLTDEEKAKKIKEYNANLKTNISTIEKQIELKELTVDLENNNGFLHPIVESETKERILELKVDLGVATNDEIEYYNMNGWEKFCANTETFNTSAFTGLFNVAETVGDGFVMLGGKVGICDEEWASEYVKFDQSADLYNYLVDLSDMNTYSAYGVWHNVGDMAGNAVGYIAMSYAAPWLTATLGGLSAMGSSSERALISGASFDDAFNVGAVSGIAGAVSGWGVGKLGQLAKSSTSLLQVGGYTMAGTVVSTLEPIVNSATEYYVYANDMVDENGNPIYDNPWDYYIDGGGLTNTIMAGVAGGISVGSRALNSYDGVQKYKKDVLSTMEESSRWDIAKSEYDAMNGEGAFKKLPEADQKKLMSSVGGKELSEKMLNNQKLVNNSVKNAKTQYKAGVFNTKYTLGEILGEYKGDQMKLWSTKGYNDWKNDFGKFVDSDGNVKVYSFQDGSIGANNIVTFGGNTSLPQGSFVMSERQYLELLADRTVFDSKGNCINPEKLSDLTGGCNFGAGKNIIAVEQTVKLDDITIPNGSHPNAYPGWWSPGGKTVTVSGVGYCTEGIVPYNNYKNGNVNIISHNSRYNTKYYTNPLTS